MNTPVAHPDSAPVQGGVSADPTRWFTTEVHPHDGQLKAYLRNKYPTVRDIDDVVQESYLRIWKARACQPIASAKAFLFRIASHLAVDLVRREKSSPLETKCILDLSTVLDTGYDAADTLLQKDLLNLVLEALLHLPERQRSVIVLHKLQGYSHREVAEKLGLTERTAEKYCSVGIERCAVYLSEKGIYGFFS